MNLTTPQIQEAEMLGISEEEYYQRHKQYLATIRKSVGEHRQKLRHFICAAARIEKGELTQAMIRRMSWTLCSLLNDPLYDKSLTQLLKPIQEELPFKIGNCNQDKNHQEHFINACLLYLLGFQGNLLTEPGPVNPGWCVTEEDETLRIELMNAVFGHLASSIPYDESTQTEATRVTNKDLLEAINELKTEITQIAQRFLEKD